MTTEVKHKKYYLAFLVDDKKPNELHCTHLYLGELPIQRLRECGAIIDDLFNFYKIPPKFKVEFDTLDMFGPENDTMVVKASDKNPFNYFKMIRATLGGAGFGDFMTYPEYNPHITVYAQKDWKPMMVEFHSYAIVSGDERLVEWFFK